MYCILIIVYVDKFILSFTTSTELSKVGVAHVGLFTNVVPMFTFGGAEQCDVTSGPVAIFFDRQKLLTYFRTFLPFLCAIQHSTRGSIIDIISICEQDDYIAEEEAV